MRTLIAAFLIALSAPSFAQETLDVEGLEPASLNLLHEVRSTDVNSLLRNGLVLSFTVTTLSGLEVPAQAELSHYQGSYSQGRRSGFAFSRRRANQDVRLHLSKNSVIYVTEAETYQSNGTRHPAFNSFSSGETRRSCQLIVESDWAPRCDHQRTTYTLSELRADAAAKGLRVRLLIPAASVLRL